MADDVSTGAYQYLGGFPDVLAVLGSFSASDPVTANRNQPYLFADDILVNLKGTSASAVVCNDFGPATSPPQGGSQRNRRLRVDIYTDPQRNAAGGVVQTNAQIKRQANLVFTVVNRHLHRRDPDTVLWGDLVTYGCTLLVEPTFTPVPDGDWMVMGSAVYQVYMAGWTDLAS